jgi:hypothetical protein
MVGASPIVDLSVRTGAASIDRMKSTLPEPDRLQLATGDYFISTSSSASRLGPSIITARVSPNL